MAKVKPLNDCKNWDELSRYADANGLPIKRVSGGHAIRGNKNGSVPFSTHQKEIPKALLHKVKKEIALLVGVALVVLFFVVPPLFF